jgi:hypothetical protein
MIRKFYIRSIVALLMIPVVSRLAAGAVAAIDPESARGHEHYVRNFALLKHLRQGVFISGLVLLGILWLLACAWWLRARSQRRAWLWLALLGPPGVAVLASLPNREGPLPGDAYSRQLQRLPQLLRVVYEVLRFVAFGFVAMQLIEWFDDATALMEAHRRGVALALVLAERDATSGMWAFGDMIRAGYLFVLMYALWPAGFNAVATLVRRLRPD